MKWGIIVELSIERKIEIERELAKALCDKNTKRNIVVDGMLGSSSDDEIKYYISVCEKQNLSQRQLQEKIKNHEYEGFSIGIKAR